MDVSDVLHIHRLFALPGSRSIRAFFVAVVCTSVLITTFHLYNPSSTSSAPRPGQNVSSYARPTRAPRKKEFGRNGYGYILELDVSDQLTSGAANLLCLQCLARQIDPKVMLVEPFIVNSTYGAVLLGSHDLLARENNVRLRDIYDIGEWAHVQLPEGRHLQHSVEMSASYFLSSGNRQPSLHLCRSQLRSH